MLLFDLPGFMKFRTANWMQSGGMVFNRSEITGKTRGLRLGPSARWTCDLDIVPTGDPEQVRLVRVFLASLAYPDRGVLMPASEEPQAASPVPATCLVKGAGQLGFGLLCDGVPNSTLILRSGNMISVQLASGDHQLLVLDNDFTSNGSGEVTFGFTQPLRESPADNAVVRLHDPVSAMRIIDPLGWTVSPGRVHDWKPLKAVEFF